MSDIDHLRERVEAAEERFGVITEQQNNYSKRIVELMNSLESDVSRFRAESKTHEAEIERLHFENEQLRGMLHSLLLSVESDSFVETMRELDSKVTALLSGAAIPVDSEVEAVEDETAAPADTKSARDDTGSETAEEEDGGMAGDAEAPAAPTDAESPEIESPEIESAEIESAEIAVTADEIADAASAAETAADPVHAEVSDPTADPMAEMDVPEHAFEDVASEEIAAEAAETELPDAEPADNETESVDISETEQAQTAATDAPDLPDAMDLAEPETAAEITADEMREAASLEAIGSQAEISEADPVMAEDKPETAAIEPPIPAVSDTASTASVSTDLPAEATEGTDEAAAEMAMADEPAETEPQAAEAVPVEPAAEEKESPGDPSVKDIIDRVSELVKDLAEAEAASDVNQEAEKPKSEENSGPASAVGS